MDNKEYRYIIDEIIECRFISDKISIIKERIRSLADLEDLLFDAELDVDEITIVLKELDTDGISALAKRYPYESDIEAIDLTESEEQLHLCLHKYIISLPQVEQIEIAKTISLLEDDNVQ